jgi:16S rRNA (cytidine1402-2'-O)-methyltransferase
MSSMTDPGTLFIVGTPLGNLGDIAPRALRTLREVDLIAAEDTRVTRKLLTHFDIHTRQVSYHRHSTPARLAEIVDRLRAGDRVALVSDAGMPGISDPGQPLIAACVAAGVAIVPVPGPSAVITALAVSGFNTDRFRFLGFLPRTHKERLEVLSDSLAQADTCAAYESPHRIAATLASLAALAPTKPVLVARELTKMFEELLRGTAQELADALAGREVLGEIVLVWPGGGLASTEDPLARAVTLARGYRAEGLSTRDAAARAAADTGAAKREIYQALLNE